MNEINPLKILQDVIDPNLRPGQAVVILHCISSGNAIPILDPRCFRPDQSYLLIGLSLLSIRLY
jgi:hypothetical protein